VTYSVRQNALSPRSGLILSPVPLAHAMAGIFALAADARALGSTLCRAALLYRTMKSGTGMVRSSLDWRIFLQDTRRTRLGAQRGCGLRCAIQPNAVLIHGDFQARRKR